MDGTQVVTPEQRRKALLFRQREVNYTTVSPYTGESQCAGCRFFIPSGSWVGNSSEPTNRSTCAIVESYPLDILPTGYCDKYDALPEDANEPEPMAVVIVDAEVERGYAAPLPARAPALKRLFGAKDPPATTFLRAADGARLAVIVTSNGYQDREQEHVATKALEEYVESQFKADTWHGDNVLDFYHWHPLDIGDIVAAAVLDGFLVEVAKERTDSPIAGLIWDYWQATSESGEVVWGASHEFKAKRDGDTFVRIQKSRTSVLDIYDAANLLTFSGVLAMSKETVHMDKIFGFEGAAQLLRDKGINAVNEELRKRGVVAKGVDTPGGTQTGASANAGAGLPPGSVIDYTPLLNQLIEATDEQQKTIDAQGLLIEGQAKEITTLKDAGEQRVKAASETTTKVDALTQQIDAQKKRLDTFMADTPRRASEDDATRLSGEQERKAQEAIDNRTTEYDPAFGDMKVPLKKDG